MFRGLLKKRRELDETQNLLRLTGTKVPESTETAIDDILAQRTTKPLEAVGMAFTLAQRPLATEQLVQAARRLVAVKVGDVHDIKFPVALFEDLGVVSPRWRPHLLATGVYSFRGSALPDHPVVQQVREALRKP
jgi:hypothetical protein